MTKKTRPNAQGPRPHKWCTGPDPKRHTQYLAFIQMRNQARWRGEEWHLVFDEWLSIWGDLWEHRGRCRDQYCMTRRDYQLPWVPDNTIIVTRGQHNQNQTLNRARQGLCKTSFLGSF